MRLQGEIYHCGFSRLVQLVTRPHCPLERVARGHAEARAGINKISTKQINKQPTQPPALFNDQTLTKDKTYISCHPRSSTSMEPPPYPLRLQWSLEACRRHRGRLLERQLEATAGGRFEGLHDVVVVV